MKKAMLILIILAFNYQTYAQEKIKQSEIGLLFSNLNNFGMSFKVGSNKFKWRFNALLLNGGNETLKVDSSKIEIISTRAGFGLAFGNEFHKAINENFEFVFGYDFFYNYSMSKYDDDVDITILQQKNQSTGFNMVFGFNYIAKEHIVFGAELLPFISWNKATKNNISRYSSSRDSRIVSEQKGISYGLTNTSARLILAYRF